MTGTQIVSNFSESYTVTVGGVAYLIYRDGSYTHAVRVTDADAVTDTEITDYTAWCDRVPAVADRDTAIAIMTEAGIELIHLGDGLCTPVSRRV